MRRILLFTLLVVGAHPDWVRAEPEPLTLRRAIEEALASSPALRAPDDGRVLAEIRERQAAARFGVKLTPAFQAGSDPAGLNQRTIGLGVSKRLPFGTSLQFSGNSYTFGSGPSEFHDAGYTVGISQPLLRGWTSVASADLEQARRGTTSAARSYADSRQQLVVSVANAHFGVLRGQRFVEAAARALDRARRLRTSSQARATVGLATELDVLRVNLLASQAEAVLVAQREALESAVDALKTLIGRPVDSELEVADVELAFADLAAPAAPAPVEALVRTALQSRLDVAEAHDRVGDAKRAETVARWNLLPPMNVDVSYTKRGLGAGALDLWGPLMTGWRFGVSTSYAIDRSDERASAAAAAVSSRAAERELIDTERRAGDEVRRVYRTWARTSITLDIQTKAVALAERQLRLAEIRYKRGIAGNFDVVDAENDLFQAQTGLIDAQVERELASLTLRRVAGTLDPDAFQP